MPIVPSSIDEIATAAKIVNSIYKALGDCMDASYDYQCLIMELQSFEQALKFVVLIVTLAPPTGRDARDIAAETTTCLELLKTFDDRIRSYQEILLLLGEEGGPWRRIGWSLFKADEVAIFRQKISQHKQNITLFLNGLMYVLSILHLHVDHVDATFTASVTESLPMRTKQGRARHRQWKGY
jgi:hypothetical protein